MQAGKTRISQTRVIGAAAEVPHVRVERLGSGDGEHDRGQREERDREMPEQEAEGVASVTAP